MDIELLKETIDRMADRNHEEFKNLAESHGVPFAASVMTTALARTLGLVLAMGKTNDIRKATMVGFAAVVDKSLDEYSASINMLEVIEKAKGASHED